MTHANAPLTPVGRLRLAKLIVDDGWAVRRAAERFQCSPATASKWAARYRAGLPMTDRSSRPRRSPSRCPRRLERRIVGLLDEAFFMYGADIDPGAVEIAKLRLWLSLVVDEEDVKQIKPLPNLDYKIVWGDSLLGFPFKSNRITKIEALKLKFFDETNAGKKKALKQEIDAEIEAAFASSKKSLGVGVSFDFEIWQLADVAAGSGNRVVRPYDRPPPIYPHFQPHAGQPAAVCIGSSK